MLLGGMPLYRPQTMLERYRYFNSVSPSTTVMNALQTFLKTLNDNSILDKFILLYPVGDTDQSSRLNLIKAGSFTLTDVGTAPTFVSGVSGAGGFTANGANLSTGFTLAGTTNVSDIVNKISHSNCTFFFDSGTTDLSTNRDFGNSSLCIGLCRTTGDVSSGRILDASTETIGTGIIDGSGLFAFERSSGQKQVYRNATSAGTAARADFSGSSGPTALHVLGNNAGTTGSRRCRLFAVSGNLTATQHTIFYNAWTAYKTAIGCT